MTLDEQLLALRRALDKATGRVEIELDKIAHVAAVLDEIAADRGPAGTAGPEAASVRRSSAEVRALREAAHAGAMTLAWTWSVDGSAHVRINDGTPFRLQAKPAALLRIIAAPGGRATDDGLVGWRTYAEVGAALAKHTGRAASARSVTQTIYKLRAAFRDAGQNWFLIQTDHRGAVRFALRNDIADPVTEPQPGGGARW